MESVIPAKIRHTRGGGRESVYKIADGLPAFAGVTVKESHLHYCSDVRRRKAMVITGA